MDFGGGVYANCTKYFQISQRIQARGDQPQAIDALVKGFQEVNPFQTLLDGEFKEFFPENAVEYFVS